VGPTAATPPKSRMQMLKERKEAPPQNAFNVFQFFEPVIVSWVLCCLEDFCLFVDVLTIVTLMDARRRFGGGREC